MEKDYGKIALTNGGVWDAQTHYEKLTMVRRSGQSYISLKDNTGVDPATDVNATTGNGTYWFLTAEKGEQGPQGPQGPMGPEGEVTSTSVERALNKSYAPAQFSGLGRVNLEKNIQTIEGVEKNILTQDMFYKTVGSQRVPNTNTIFVIQYDYDLNDPNGVNPITIPEGCVLKFDGGSLSNGKIVGKNTSIEADIVQIFRDDIEFNGTWNVAESYPQWFGAKADYYTIKTDNSVAFQKCFNSEISKNITVPKGTYYIDSTLILTGRDKTISMYGATIYYSGKSHFIQLGLSVDSRFDKSTIRGGLLLYNERYSDTTHPNVNGNLFHVIYATFITLEDVNFYGGETGFHCGGDGFVGFYNGLFINCSQGFASKNGFNFKPSVSGVNQQINAICLIRTNASNNGTPPNSVDNENGNGFVLGGISIGLLNCNAEVNAGYGIKVPDNYYIRGLTLSTIHCENCLKGGFYLGKPETSNDNKIDVFATSIHRNTNTPSNVIGLNETDCKLFNIVINDEIYNSKLISSNIGVGKNKSFYYIEPVLCQQKIPSIIEYKPKNAYSDSIAIRLSVGILIGGESYHIVSGGIPHIVTGISENTVTIDGQFTYNNKSIIVVNTKHPCWLFGRSILLNYPIIAYVSKLAEDVTKSAGDSQVSLSSTLIANTELSVGDIIVEYESSYTNARRNEATINLMFTLREDMMGYAELPDKFKYVPDYIKKMFVLKLIKINNVDSIEFDYFRTRNLEFGKNYFSYNAERLIPSSPVWGDGGKIPNIEAGKYLIWYSTSNYYNNSLGTVDIGNDYIDVTSSSTYYGYGYIFNCSVGGSYGITLNGNYERTEFAFYDSEGNYIGKHQNTYVAKAPSNAAFGICLICGDEVHVTDICIGPV